MSRIVRRAAVFVAAVLGLGVVVAPSPAQASISGEAVFFVSPFSSHVVVLAGGLRAETNGYTVEQVLAGHFTSDAGAQAFLYNPGPGHDGLLEVTSGGVGLSTSLTEMPVGGRFKPFVADLDLDGHDDIFWYAPGTARDYVWFFEDDGSVTSVPMRVDLDAQPIPVLIDGINAEPDHQGILWYGHGERPDAWWLFHGRAPAQRRVSIAGRYRTAVGEFGTMANYGTSKEQVLFYDANGGRSWLWTFHRGDGAHRSDAVSGTPGPGYQPIVTTAGMHDGWGWIYWYGPGRLPEQLSHFGKGAALVTQTASSAQIGSTTRVMLDPKARSASEEVVLLGDGTQARTLQLAAEHSPAFGTVTPINSLPKAPRAASTWFETPVA